MRKKWEEFEKKHEKIAKLLIQLLYFWVFSMGVTVLQYLMFTFFPYMFGIEYAGQEFMWPQIPMHVFGIDYKWNILGYEVARNAAGEVIIGDWDILSVMSWEHFWHSVSIFLYREILRLKVMGILHGRFYGILSHGY